MPIQVPSVTGDIRLMYGGRASDVAFTLTAGVLAVYSGAMTVWDSNVGGNQVTQLLDVAENPIITVSQPAAVSGVVPPYRFYGPLNYTGPLWVQVGSVRFQVDPADLAVRA